MSPAAWPEDSLAAQVFTPPPEAVPPLGDPEAVEPRAWGRQAGPGRAGGLVAFLLALQRAFQARGAGGGGFTAEGARPGTAGWPSPRPAPRRTSRGFGDEGRREG